MDAPGTFFVTKCLANRGSAMSNDAADIIATALCHLVTTDTIVLGAFLVMPDHWHAVIGLRREESISSRMRAIDRWINKSVRGCVWQQGFYETRIRSTKQLLYVIDYIENNPVRKELVQEREQWRWSSAYERFAEYIAKPWPWGFELD